MQQVERTKTELLCYLIVNNIKSKS